METAELLALFDKEQRIEIRVPGMQREATPRVIRHVSLPDAPGEGFVLYSCLKAGEVDAAIREQIAYFDGIGQAFEWKVFDHDTPPDLVDRLRAHGFEIEDPEAVMVLDLDEASPALTQPVSQKVRRLDDPTQLTLVLEIQERVWGEEMGWLAERLADEMRRDGDNVCIYIAYADGVPACSGWVRFHPPTQFASLNGGSTLLEYRGRGLYSALLAVRVQEALRRGARFLTIDASPMSRPIVAKHGFRLLSYAHACNWSTDSAAQGAGVGQ